ncbi:metabotropic glutamate receptor 5 [Caerostris darwini]|uniref:Metabotropic glutamate receptor 5 n=1 Tax=Caerostris darwini TaxID=1538125 RepID=A0AAV4UJF3_9ARAC|nr:metabotropic glutamate receptor 5 [Caerostris darwini]
MNFFVRLRISKQDKIAANVAQHIRAVRAAEALDRRTRLRRTDSFNFPGIPSTILPVTRSTSNGEEPPGVHDKKRLVGMIKKAYTEEVIEEIPSHVEDVACQTSYDLLEAMLPSLRRRVLRSETSMNTDDEDIRYSGTPCKMGACHHKRPAYCDSGGRHYSVCDPSHGSMNAAYDAASFTSRGSSRPRSRNRHRNDGREDRVEVEYKIPSDSDLLDYDVEEVISLREMKKSKALQLMAKKSQYNKLHATVSDGTSLCLPMEGTSETSFSPTVSQDSLIDATSSIIEESASTGSDETTGGAVYKNIIINLGSNQDKSPGRHISAPHSSTTSSANLSILPSIADSRISHSQENVNERGKHGSPDVSKWSSPPNGNPKGLAM